MQTTHVAVDSGNPEETGTVIDQRFKARGVEILLACQIDQDAGIEIATARPHDHSAGWGQAHAGVNGRPSTASSIRQWRRRFGPPCTTRCPTATGWVSLQSARNLPRRVTASRWVPKSADSEANRLPFLSLAQNLPSRPPIDSASPETSIFGMKDSTR